MRSAGIPIVLATSLLLAVMGCEQGPRYCPQPDASTHRNIGLLPCGLGPMYEIEDLPRSGCFFQCDPRQPECAVDERCVQRWYRDTEESCNTHYLCLSPSDLASGG